MVLLTTFLIATGLALILILTGNFFKDKEFGVGLGIAGFTFLLIIGLTLLNSNISIKSGEEVVENYSYNNGTLDSTTKTISYNYTEQEGRIPWLTAIIILLTGVFGLGAGAARLFDMRKEKDEDIDRDF